MRGDGRLFKKKGSAIWWIACWGPSGDGESREHRESTRTTDRNQAEEFLKTRRAEIAKQACPPPARSGSGPEWVTVSELLDNLEGYYAVNRPKSLRTARSHMHHIREAFGSERAVSVTGDRIRAYAARRLEEGVKPATVNRETEKLHRAFRLAIEDGKLTFAPRIRFLREDNARQGFISAADFKKRMEKVDDPGYRDLFEWLYWSGMRTGAVLALSWEGFDRETWTLNLHASADKIGRGLPLELTGIFRTIIERRLAARRLDCPLIFHRNGRRISNRYLRAWHWAGRAAGVPERVVYDLRRTALRNNVRAGIPERVCMALSGHRTREVFDRYNIVDPRDLQAASLKRAAYEDRLLMQKA